MQANGGHNSGQGVSRRRLLGALGVGAAGVAAVGAERALHPHAAGAQSSPGREDRFSRMFNLVPFAEPSDRVKAALVEMGKPGGMMDAKDPLEKGPVLLITDPALSAGNPNNPAQTAGTTFLGQFLDHDMTFDATTRLGEPAAPEQSPNGRTPRFDLDSVYGAGPRLSPQLYSPDDRIKLRVESGGKFEDLPRMADNTAIIGDPRNDENLIISGLQAAFLLFHNRTVDYVRDKHRGWDNDKVFEEARRLTTWHYQWIIVNEFLPQTIGRPLLDDILNRGRRFYTANGNASIPVEFSGAAYRYGHSLIRPSYRANLRGDNGRPFFALVFDAGETGKADPNDLSGGVRAPRRFIDWQTFFDFGDGEVKPNKKIDPILSTPLFNLPLPIIHGLGPASLASRNLLRHLTWALPSGQAIAQRMGVTPLSAADLRELRDLGVGFESSTPLWYYVLKEAQRVERGERLGPVGGRIVGEVFIGLLQADSDSFMKRGRGWKPELPARTAGTFKMTDLLTFAGVDPASRSGTTSPSNGNGNGNGNSGRDR